MPARGAQEEWPSVAYALAGQSGYHPSLRWPTPAGNTRQARGRPSVAPDPWATSVVLAR